MCLQMIEAISFQPLECMLSSLTAMFTQVATIQFLQEHRVTNLHKVDETTLIKRCCLSGKRFIAGKVS